MKHFDDHSRTKKMWKLGKFMGGGGGGGAMTPIHLFEVKKTFLESEHFIYALPC